MAVTRIERRPGGGCSRDANGLKETRIYRVYANAPITPYQAMTASVGGDAIPDWNEEHEVNSTMIVTNISAQGAATTDGAGFVHDVTVTWSIPPYDPTVEATTEGSKWNRQITMRGVPYTENTNIDVNELQIVNSMNEVYHSSIPRTRSDLEITISVSGDNFNWTLLHSYLDKINDDSVTMTIDGLSLTFPAHTLRVQSIEASRDLAPDADGDRAWKVTVVLGARSRKNPSDDSEYGWDVMFPDQGNFYLVGSIVQRSETLVHLDGAGGKLENGDPAVLIGPYQMDEEIDFTNLLEAI